MIFRKSGGWALNWNPSLRPVPSQPRICINSTLILEEVVANVIAYAYDDNGRHEITVRVERKDRELIMEVEDDGRPLDLQQASQPNLARPLEDMPVGGLGNPLCSQVRLRHAV